MSPQLNIVTSESAGGGGLPTSTGTAYIAVQTDEGPPQGGPAYVQCSSLSGYINAFGPRSSTSAAAYDWLDEFFNEGGTTGKTAYVTRVTDTTATTATLVLNDALSTPTVSIAAQTPGTAGNLFQVSVVPSSAATFKANTTASSNTLANVSSFTNIGAGTTVTGTGIPANTFITAVNQTGNTATLSQPATAAGTQVTITPGQVTVNVASFDGSGNELEAETHGPYTTTAQLFADKTSSLVNFAQATGANTNLPTQVTNVALAGGGDATDVNNDQAYVAALNNFPASLPCGTVALPGRSSQAAWIGIRNHCNANNRFGLLDQTDAAASPNAVSQMNSLPAGDWSRCVVIQGSVILNGIGSGPQRIAAGSSAAAALIAQVAQTNNQAQAPAFLAWPLTYLAGFTTFFGPGGNFSQADVNTMEAVGVNCFANFYNTLVLFGFVTPEQTDLIFDQGTAGRERMALISDFQQEMAPYLGRSINLATLESLQTDLNGIALEHYNAGALYDQGTGQAASAFTVTTAPPINTPATAQAKQINALLQAHIVRYADDVNGSIVTIPVSVSLPGSTASNS